MTVKKTHYPSGQIWLEDHYALDGTAKIYYDSGQIPSETLYVDGKKHEICKYWYESGQILSEVPYANGTKISES